MLETLFQPLIVFLHHHPHSAGIISFLIVFGEAMAVIGTIFPGSVTMSAIGLLIGSGIIPSTSTLLWAVAGAISGDFLSYLIGYWYKQKLRRIWPFTRYPSLLEKGEYFFRHHGGKSVIIGRFFGPMRSMVPLIAGMLHMKPGRFILAAIPSASIWALVYMIPGILLGALSLEFPPGLALEFLGVAFLILLFALLLTWSVKWLVLRFAITIDSQTARIWNFLYTHKSSHWITKLLTDPIRPENHHQLISSTYAIGAILCFVLVFISVYSHGFLTMLNNPIYYLFRNLRNNIADNIALVITILGNAKVMISGGALMFGWFCISRKWRTAIHWLAAVFLSSGSVYLLKAIFFSPRPNNLLNGPVTSSFTSGHTTLTVTMFGLLTFFLAQELQKDYRKLAYTATVILAFLVALSRLFLGAHWLTDILGGTFLGLSIILVVATSYRRSHIPILGKKRTFLASIIIFGSVWLVGCLLFFPQQKYNYTMYWPTYTLSKKELELNKTKKLMLYRINRLGHPKDAFNVEWLGNLSKIKKVLLKNGWDELAPCITLKGILYRLSTTNSHSSLPLLPQLHQNRCPVLLFIKKGNRERQTVVLRLWKSNINIKDSKYPFWLGVSSYLFPSDILLTLVKRNKMRKFFYGATKELVPSLKNYKWQQFVFPKNIQPSVMQKLHWDGKILLITQRS